LSKSFYKNSIFHKKHSGSVFIKRQQKQDNFVSLIFLIIKISFSLLAIISLIKLGYSSKVRLTRLREIEDSFLYEKHKTSPQKNGFDSNYAGSAFIVLALVNELKKNNISEEKAFELVFREFWIQRAKQPSGWNWQTTFKNTFGMTLDEFYERLSKYKRKDLKKILPSKTLKIQDIFS